MRTLTKLALSTGWIEQAQSKWLSEHTKSHSSPSKCKHSSHQCHLTAILHFRNFWKHCSFLRWAILFQPASTASSFSCLSSNSNSSGLFASFTIIHIHHARTEVRNAEKCKKAKHPQNSFERIRKTVITNNIRSRGVSLANHYSLSKSPDVWRGQALMFSSWLMKSVCTANPNDKL